MNYKYSSNTMPNWMAEKNCWFILHICLDCLLAGVYYISNAAYDSELKFKKNTFRELLYTNNIL